MQLATADMRTRHAKTAQEFMSDKGYPDIRPVGVTQVEEDECWYYYYHLPEGLLELEVFQQNDDRRYHRRVTAFVTDKQTVSGLFGS